MDKSDSKSGQWCYQMTNFYSLKLSISHGIPIISILMKILRDWIPAFIVYYPGLFSKEETNFKWKEKNRPLTKTNLMKFVNILLDVAYYH